MIKLTQNLKRSEHNKIIQKKKSNQNLYRCPKNHVRCEDCNSSFCTGCSDIQNWARAKDLEVFYNVVPLPCRWNCSNVFLSELRTHEQKCPLRTYKCPELYCEWKGGLNGLIKHWHSDPNLVEGYKRVLRTYVREIMEFYLIFDKELFYCRVGPAKDEGRVFHVRKSSGIGRDLKNYYVEVVFFDAPHERIVEKRRRKLKLGTLKLLGMEDFGEAVVFSLSICKM